MVTISCAFRYSVKRPFDRNVNLDRSAGLIVPLTRSVSRGSWRIRKDQRKVRFIYLHQSFAD